MSGECARRAVRILAAARTANLTELQAQLAPAPVAADDERFELLDAVARQMSTALARLRRGINARWEGAEVCLALLEHLAEGESRAVI